MTRSGSKGRPRKYPSKAPGKKAAKFYDALNRGPVRRKPERDRHEVGENTEGLGDEIDLP